MMHGITITNEDRMVTLNGANVWLKKDPRFGFWKIQLEEGQIPQALTGSYTSSGDAFQAAKAYYENEESRYARRQSPKAKAKVNEVRKEMGLKEI